MTAAAAALERAYHDERAAVLATLTRRLDGNLEIAEDAVQAAVLAAAEAWPRRGVPERPGAWLTTTAWRKALDTLRHEKGSGLALPHEHSADMAMQDLTPSLLDDDRLRLIFTCCHPALALEARVALTLRSVAGLTVAELGRALVVSETAMERRLVRARQKIRAAGIPYRVPSDDLLPERLGGVHRVVYLVFNEGHTATAGDNLVRGELCDEAIRLGRMLARLMPDDAETFGLLALMLLADARRDARIDRRGAYVALDEQDRSRWDREKIAGGLGALDRALRLLSPGPYTVQAAIAALHAEAASWEETDWPQIAELYAELARHDPSPVAAVNRAVAVAHAEGTDAGLALLDDLAGERRLDRYQPLHAARAELLRRVGDLRAADAAYGRAIELSANERERAELERRRAALR